MKQKVNITFVTFITLISLNGCTVNRDISPTQNKELDAISPTKSGKKAGFMQNSLDKWLKEEWTPTVENNPTIQQKYMTKEKVVTMEENNTTKEEVKYTEDKNRKFTLQEYVDKAVAYQKAKPSDDNASHVKQMETLPVIGK